MPVQVVLRLRQAITVQEAKPTTIKINFQFKRYHYGNIRSRDSGTVQDRPPQCPKSTGHCTGFRRVRLWAGHPSSRRRPAGGSPIGLRRKQNREKRSFGGSPCFHYEEGPAYRHVCLGPKKG